MRYNLILALIALLGISGASRAQERVDTIYNPPIVYSGLPAEYEIADIRVQGADNYEDYIVIGYSGLKKGDKILLTAFGAGFTWGSMLLVWDI